MPALLIALVISLITWGIALSPRHTLSTESQAKSIHPMCRVSPERMECAAHYHPLGSADPAPAWVENPIDYFYRDAARISSRLPHWSPYIGSGYPIIFDGHNGHFSPTRFFLRHFPGDAGRDLIIFLRACVWVIGVALLCRFCGAGLLSTGLVSIGAAFATSFTGMIDHVFLDVHALAPWFGVIIAGYCQGALGLRAALLSAALFGALLASLGFLQAQFAAVVGVIIVAAVSARTSRGRSLLIASAAGGGFLLLWPAWLPLIRNLSGFMSSRDALNCIAASDKAGLVPFFRGLTGLVPATYLAATPAGLALIAITGRRWHARYALGAFACFLAIVIGGMPLACGVPGISGVRFAQHLFPHAQAYFLVGVALGMDVVSRRVTAWQWRGAIAALIFLLVMPPFIFPKSDREGFPQWLVRGNAPTQFEALPARLPADSPWAKVQELSEGEDRRHYSPWGFMAPNWPAALRILDLRLIAALYPKPYFALNAGLFDRWLWHPVHGLKPDRFVSPERPWLAFDPDFQRVLIVNRVSLLTFARGAAFFAGEGSPYGKEHCRLLRESESVEAYVCPEVGGVGFFPTEVRRVASSVEALGVLKTTPVAKLQGLAAVESDVEVAAGRGKVLGVFRHGDDLVYDVFVDEPGAFVVADTWFAGWHADIDGMPTSIHRANVGFKAVEVPRGAHRVAFHFSPERW